MSHNYEESRTQKAIVRHVRRFYAVKIAHVANGGYRGRLEAVRLKDEGVEAGYPDLVIHAPGARTFFMEVKAEHGTLSDRQKAVHAELRRMDFEVAVVRSVEEAAVLCGAWELPEKSVRLRTGDEMATGF